MLVAANVRKARLHDARHTAATILLVLNVPVRAVMEIMGWSEASMRGTTEPRTEPRMRPETFISWKIPGQR